MKKGFTIAFLCFAISAWSQLRTGTELEIKDSILLKQYKARIPALLNDGKAMSIARNYKLIGDYYMHNWVSDSMLFYYGLALSYYEQVKDSFNIYYCQYRIVSESQLFLEADKKTLQFFLPAADYFERTNEYSMAVNCNYSISQLYLSHGDSVNEQNYLRKAVAQNKLAKDTNMQVILLSAQADIYRKRNDREQSLMLTEQMLVLGRAIRSPLWIKFALSRKGEDLYFLSKPEKAVESLMEGYETVAANRWEHKNALKFLVLSYLKLGDQKNATKFFDLYDHALDSIRAIEDRDNYEELEVKYEAEKKQAQIASLKKENDLREKNDHNNRKFIAGLSVLLILLLIAGWVILRNISSKQKAKAELLLKREEFAHKLQLEKDEKITAEFEKQTVELQLTALSAQMNPHFIFNCMNSIQKFILKSEKTKAMEFLQHFSELMRHVLDSSTKIKIGLDEEINMLERYINLEQQRLEHQFDYRIVVADTLQTDFFEIPTMIIQPYVENAIWHGLMNKKEKGFLLLKFDYDNSFIKCTLEDDGVGRKRAEEIEKSKSPRRKSYGMAITQKRLELLQKENMKTPKVVIEDLYSDNMQPAGTRVTIFMQTN